MTIEEVKKDYNELLVRFNNANSYFEDKDTPDKEKEIYLEVFKSIIGKLGYYLTLLEVYTHQECMEGFK